MEMEKIIKKLRRIALRDIRGCYHNNDVFASKINFSDYWARDTFWASYGLMEIGESDKVRQSLKLFLNHQRNDGKIPRKICLDYNLFKYIGFKLHRKKPRPIFTSPIKCFFSLDDNLLLIISFCRYIERTGDLKFAKKHFRKIHLALKFYENKKLINHFLLYETGLGNWMDTIFKHGAVLYTNCLWYEALKNLEKLSDILNFKLKTAIPKSGEVLDEIQKKLWLENEGHFCDSFYGTTKKRYFDLAGNILTIIFKIAKEKQSASIIAKADSLKTKKDIFHPINNPRYPFWKISPVTFPLGIHNYQNQNSWSWIEIMLILAKLKINKKEAEKNLKEFSEIIIKDKTICETYNLDGTPFDHLFWKSARPFAWSSGLLLWVLSEFEKDINRK